MRCVFQKASFLILVLLLTRHGSSQDSCKNLNTAFNPEIVGLILVEEMPRFNNEIGLRSFSKYVQSRLIYPDSCSNENINTIMIVSFVVDTTGSLAEIQVIKSICPEMDKAICKILSESPKWESGLIRNEKVAVQMTMPIHIHFQ